MIIYKDIFGGDEMISDAFDMTLSQDVVYEVDCKFITVGKGADVDIGANASAEEQAETLEDGQESVNDVIFSFRLVQTSFDRKSYFAYLKGYMKRVKEHLTQNGASPEEIKAFEDGAKKFVESRLTSQSFKDAQWEFYIGESMDVNGMIVLLNYREDGKTPYMVFWKHGLKEEKV
ncbi:translationally-controlled tumor protein [Tuber borchii]|uniref:Translationally-controlled tumor protein homolog n=1 Tax=Tuber borchii TaxID=42251 RepID=A0A2T7A829_TUBBO|nr:translationally-controlled tumor protein [Tuber borchii]